MPRTLSKESIAKPAMVLFIATVLGGACNFFFQVFMGPVLGTDNYSELTALLSIFYIVSVPTQTVGTTLLKYTSKFKAEGKEGEISWLISRTFWISLLAGLIMALCIFVSMPELVSYLSLHSEMPVFILMIGLVIAMVSPIGYGPAQGLQRFNILGAYSLAGPLGKLFFGFLLVVAGFGVAGAFGGVVVGSFFALMICFLAIRDYLFRKDKKRVDTKGIFIYMVPVTVGVVCFTMITNVDTFFARHYFSNYDASLYSAASMLGKVILWLPGAIGTVMFPKVSVAHAKKEDTKGIMRKSILLTLAIGGIVAIGYALMPEFVLNLFYGVSFTEAAPALAIVGVSMALFSLAGLFLSYGLATDGYGFVMILSIFTALQIGLMAVFHSTIVEFALDMLVTSLGICVVSWLYMEARFHPK